MQKHKWRFRFITPNIILETQWTKADSPKNF